MRAARPLEPPRRQYLDWLRGIAVLLMILWHAIDSWHEPANRTTTRFIVVGFLAGWAAPIFLFLAGVSMALAGARRAATGMARLAVAHGLARRGWQVFFVAHLFRLQSFLLNPNASWHAILKPDILNILGLALVVAPYLWLRAVGFRARVLWLLLPTVVVLLVLTPLSPTWWWPTLLHPRIEAYIRPVGNWGQFSLFPAIAFVFGGVLAGVFLADRSPEREGRFHGRASGVAAGLVVCGLAVERASLHWPIAWALPAAVVIWRSGAILGLMSLSWLWLARRKALPAWHPLILFGQTSLFVYFIHVEIAYGWISYPLWKGLSFAWAMAAYAAFAVLLYGAAYLWRRRPRGALIPGHLVASRI